jgi:hypothetical protein
MIKNKLLFKYRQIFLKKQILRDFIASQTFVLLLSVFFFFGNFTIRGIYILKIFMTKRLRIIFTIALTYFFIIIPVQSQQQDTGDQQNIQENNS